jgi:hypothetical protein
MRSRWKLASGVWRRLRCTTSARRSSSVQLAGALASAGLTTMPGAREAGAIQPGSASSSAAGTKKLPIRALIIAPREVPAPSGRTSTPAAILVKNGGGVAV